MCTSLFAGSIPVGSTIFDKHIVSEENYECKAYSCKTRRIHCGSSWTWWKKWRRLKWRWWRGMLGIDRHYICDLGYSKLLGNTCHAGDSLRCHLADLDFSPSYLARSVLDFYKTQILDLCWIQGAANMLFPKKTFAESHPIF